jgi:16S rRNA (adenine1518-N6/adenine1519-N6)-dimethyltransferase
MSASNQMRIAEILKRHGLRLDRHLGQHFLVDENLLHRVAKETGAASNTDVVEIGAGVGNLSYMLALSGARVTAIELDRRFEPVHREVVLATPDLEGRLQFVYADALDFDFAAASAAAKASGREFAIAGNIPYQITSPLIMRIFETGTRFDSMVLMMQREVAERLASGPGTKRNGAISIKVQYFSEVEPLFDVPARAFLPPPEVTSRVLRFTPRMPPIDVPYGEFFPLVDAAFAQRRKVISNSIAARGIGYSREQVDAALTELKTAPTTRAEQLGLPEFLALHAALQQRA